MVACRGGGEKWRRLYQHCGCHECNYPDLNKSLFDLVMPGIYEEQVTLDEYVHLKGAGTHSTVISSQANTNNFNDDAAVTLIVPANSQVSDLRVRNNSTSDDAVALKVKSGNEETILDNVSVVTNGGGGDQHIALYLNSGNPQLSHIAVEVSGGAANNFGHLQLRLIAHHSRF